MKESRINNLTTPLFTKLGILINYKCEGQEKTHIKNNVYDTASQYQIIVSLPISTDCVL